MQVKIEAQFIAGLVNIKRDRFLQTRFIMSELHHNRAISLALNPLMQGRRKQAMNGELLKFFNHRGKTRHSHVCNS